MTTSFGRFSGMCGILAGLAGLLYDEGFALLGLLFGVGGAGGADKI